MSTTADVDAAQIVRNLLASIAGQAEHLDDISDPEAFVVLAGLSRDLLNAFFDYPPDHDEDESDEYLDET